MTAERATGQRGAGEAPRAARGAPDRSMPFGRQRAPGPARRDAPLPSGVVVFDRGLHGQVVRISAAGRVRTPALSAVLASRLDAAVPPWPPRRKRSPAAPWSSANDASTPRPASQGRACSSVGTEPEHAGVRDDGDPDGVPREQRHVGEDLAQRRAERVQPRRGARTLVIVRLNTVAAEHGAPEQLAEQRRRRPARSTSALPPTGCGLFLSRFGAPGHAAVAGQRIRLEHRAVPRTLDDEDVTGPSRVLDGADVDRDLRPQASLRGRLPRSKRPAAPRKSRGRRHWPFHPAHARSP